MRLFSIISLIVLGLITFSNTFQNSFHFDDIPTIVDNLAIHDITNLNEIINFWPTRCINYLTLALNYHWDGLNVFGYHVLSLAIHIGCSILVWYLALLTVNSPWFAFFAAAILLVHPLQTQPINYIMQRATLLTAFFYLSSVVFYIKFRQNYQHKVHYTAWISYYCAGLLSGGLSMFCKETAISLPLMIYVYELNFLKSKRDKICKLIYPFLFLIFIIPITWLVKNPIDIFHLDAMNESYAGGVGVKEYFLTQINVLITYLRLLFWPVHQAVDYDYPLVYSLLNFSVIKNFVLLGSIIVCSILYRNKLKLMAFGVFWFFITLLPESTIWPNKDVIFEHRLYLPMVGFSIFLTGTLFYVFKRERVNLAIRILFLLIAAYSVLSYQRNKVWLNEFTLWDDAVRKFPKNARAYLNRGSAYHFQGDLDHALADYNMVIGLGPVTAVTLSNRGSIFKAKGEFELALANFNLAIEINPSYIGTYVNRGLLYQEMKDYQKAINDFTKVLELNPKYHDVYMYRKQAYADLQNNK